AYRYRVTAITEYGPISNAQGPVFVLEPPTAPQEPDLRFTPDGMLLEWSPPAYEGYPGVTGYSYVLEHAPDENGPWEEIQSGTTGVDTTTAHVTMKTEAGTYRLRVAAFSEHEAGPEAVITATPSGL